MDDSVYQVIYDFRILSPTNKFLGGIVESGLRVRPSVSLFVRDDNLTNHLIVCSETLQIYLLPLCNAFSQVSENKNSKYQSFLKVIGVREALPKFSIVSKSVRCLCSCSLVKHLFCRDIIALAIYLLFVYLLL